MGSLKQKCDASIAQLLSIYILEMDEHYILNASRLNSKCKVRRIEPYLKMISSNSEKLINN